MERMDTNASSGGEDLTFLTHCVSEEMSASEAADSTRACWVEAEDALTPVIGRGGLGMVFRRGEAMAVRNVGVIAPSSARASIDLFCDWVRGLKKEQAFAACKSFLQSVESYLVSLVGTGGLKRILGRSRMLGGRRK
jgi:hypothetical protein